MVWDRCETAQPTELDHEIELAMPRNATFGIEIGVFRRIVRAHGLRPICRLTCRLADPWANSSPLQI